MGKIVKFCSECDEGFAEKFGFCPNCGASLEAFEMNPLQAAKPKIIQPEKPEFITSPEPIRETSAVEELSVADDDILELNVEGEDAKTKEEVFTEPETAEEEFVPAATVYSSNENSTFSSNGNSDYKPYQQFSNADVTDEDDGFHVTVIEEKNVKQRNGLLLGSTAFMLFLIFGGFIYSLFAKSFDLAAIGSDDYIDMINDVGPVDVEDEKPPEVSDKKAGGGGGGGREEETETSKGRLATQSREESMLRPDKSIPQMNTSLKYPPATTTGDKKIPPTNENYGIPNSTNPFGSNGRGKGGGQGEGEGDGQGGGRGRGAGNGEGTGFGDGKGDSTGDDEGSGPGGRTKNPPPREPESSGPSKALNITFKPKPKYTDEARQKNITGNVRVRVTFLPSGQIGSVAPVSNLGYGLTEQAIAAARGIRFEPQMQNGRAVAVTKVVVFTFTIY